MVNSKMKPLPTFQEAITVAINEVKDAMIENIMADQSENEAKDRRKKAHYTLQKANERLRNLQSDMYEINLRKQ
jgi:ElaB/YqjD/DUF883 family membrane-anchored ribosome-binding protein